MRYDTPENLDRVHESALIAAREAVATLNALEGLKQPSKRVHYELRRRPKQQMERDNYAVSRLS